MRPANGSATVFHTNAAAGPRVRGRRRVVVAVLADAVHAALGRRRHVGDDRVEQRLHRRCWRPPRRRSTGKIAAAATPRFEPADQLLLRQRAGVEELLHQRVVGLGDHLDQRFARRLGRRLHLARAPAPRSACRCLAGERPRLHRHQVDDAVERLLFADRQLDRDDGAAEHAAQRLERAVEAGALAVEPVEDDDARHARAPRPRPTSFRSTPRRRATASTTTSAASATRSAARASLRKFAMPGVSMKLILVLFHSA